MAEQLSKEWFEQRKGRITGSRIGAILGLSPWAKPRDIMRQMVRDYHGAPSEFDGNVATAYGNQHEPLAKFDFELETGLEIIETGLHVHPDYDWLAASPDGLIGEDAVLEIKCPYGLRDGGEFKPLAHQPHYYAQVQFEMYCTGRSKCHFYQWSSVSSSLETVDFNQHYVAVMLVKLREFYEQFQKEIKDPERHLLPLIKNKLADDVADEYLSAKSALEEAQAKLDSAKQKLLAIADGEKSNISGLLVYPQQRKGSISYAKVVKDLLPDADLEAYRGEPSTVWVIK